MTSRTRTGLIIGLAAVILVVGVFGWLSKAGKLKIGADVAGTNLVSYQSIASISNTVVKLPGSLSGTWTIDNNIFYFIDKDTKVVKAYNLKTQQLESAPTCPTSTVSTTCGSFLVNAQNSTYLFSFSSTDNQSKVYKLANNAWVQFGDVFNGNLSPRRNNDNLWSTDRTKLAFFNGNGMVEFDFTTGKWSNLEVQNEFITKTSNPNIFLIDAVRLSDNTSTAVSAKSDALYKFLPGSSDRGGSNGVVVLNLSEKAVAIKNYAATLLNHSDLSDGIKVQKGSEVFIFGSTEPLISGSWLAKISGRSEKYNPSVTGYQQAAQEITTFPSGIRPQDGKVINSEIYILATDSSGIWKLIWVKMGNSFSSSTAPTTSLATTTTVATTAVVTTIPPLTTTTTTTAVTFAQYDLNCDGKVDKVDSTIIDNLWGNAVKINSTYISAQTCSSLKTYLNGLLTASKSTQTTISRQEALKMSNAITANKTK